MRRTWFLILVLLVTIPAPLFGKGPERTAYIHGEVLVQFRSGVSERLAQATHGLVGSETIGRFRHVGIDRVRIPDGWSVDEAVELYRLDPDVKFAEPNYYRYAADTPNDTLFHLQWGLHNIGQSGGTQDADVDGPEAWSTQAGNSGVVIAVLDTGVDLDHQDIQANIWMNDGEDWVNGNPGNNGVDDDGNGKIDDYRGWDFANNDNDPDDDSDGHGTHVAGIIAADGNNGVGVAGVAWSASIMPLKMLSGGKGGLVSHEIAAIDYAVKNGAQIINASLGGSNFSQLEYNAIERARDAGVLFVAAAGNSGTNNDTTPVYPASHDLDNIISVAATDQYDDLMSSSNFGVSSVDVAAPGSYIYNITVGNRYQFRSGTSMAAAHVSGLACLVLSGDFNLTCNQIRGRILSGADAKGSLSGYVSTSGRVNAYASITGIPSPTSSGESSNPSGSGGGGGGGGGGCFIGTATNSIRMKNFLDFCFEFLD